MLRLSEKTKTVIPEALCSLLFSCGLSFGVSVCLFGYIPFAKGFCYCALGAAAVLLSGLSKRLKLLPLFCVLAGEAIAFQAGRGVFFYALQTARGMLLYARGNPNAMLPLSEQAACVFSFVFGVLGALFVRSRACGACVTLCAAVFAAETALTGADSLLLYCALPCLAGCAGTAALSSRRALYVPLAAAVCLAALSFLLVPEEDTRVSPFSEAADAVRQDFEDHFLFTGTRESFSLSSYGYMPLGTALGGKAEPDERQVLSVKTDSTVYLRAVASDTYNGISWYDTLGTRRYLYTAVNRRDTLRQVFDMERPAGETEGKKQEASVTVVASTGATTLFAPQRVREIKTLSDRMTLYWNEGSELFISRNADAGDSYRFSWLPLDADDPAVQRMAERCAALEDAQYSAVAASYLSLPQHMQREVFEIAATAAAGESDPLRRALNIRDYLRSRFSYSLDVSAPPANTDFCAWFLLREKKGYCTYFATALTLLCRMQGIPARYVTGFLAVPQNGVAAVTGKDAHAWCEVYLNGLGWLTLDATPGDRGADTGGDEHNDTPYGGEVAPTPSPSPAPQPEPTPPPPAAQEEQPEQEAVPPSPVPPQSGTAPSAAGAAGGKESSVLWLLLLLVPLLLTAWVLLRSPAVRMRIHPDRAEMILLTDLEKRLAVLRLKRSPEETVSMFAARVAALSGKNGMPLLQRSLVFATAEAVNRYLYGGKPLQTDTIVRACRMVTSVMPVWRKCYYYAKR